MKNYWLNKANNFVLGLIPIISIIILWQAIYSFKIIPGWLLPSPLDTIKILFSLFADGTLIRLIFVSTINVIPAFVLAVMIALILGVLIGLNKTISKMFFPMLAALNAVPSLAWIPLIIIFLGFSRETVWAVIFISSFMKMIFNVITGIKNVNQNWVLSALNVGLNRLEIIWKIIIPGSMPYIITGLRLGFGSAWRSLIGAEMLVMTVGGLGKFIWMSQWYFDFSKVIIGITIIALIGVIIEILIFGKWEKSMLKNRGLYK
ncbi:MAG: ABC transporter permease [bacterium]